MKRSFPNNSKPQDGAVILFVKAPQKGTVKTRLAGTVGDASALALYRCFVTDVLDMLKTTGRPLRIYYHPPENGKRISEWLGDGLDIFPQTGGDLGEKMKQALSETFAAGYDRAIIVGSDLPDLPPEIVQEAFGWLRNNPAVVGPGRDGGYYLIGFTAGGFVPAIFDNIAWGTAAVLGQTLKRFARIGVVPRLLPVWRDIDTAADLDALARSLPDASGAAAHTMNYLQQQNPYEGRT